MPATAVFRRELRLAFAPSRDLSQGLSDTQRLGTSVPSSWRARSALR